MTATRTVTFLLVVSLLLFAACETDLPPLPDDPPAPGDEGGTNIVGQATNIGDERFSKAQFSLTPNPAEIPTRISIISNDTIIWSSGYVSIDADEWSEFSLAGERVQNTNWLRAGAQAEIPLDEQTPASENNYAIIYSCNLENNQWNCRENKWQMQQFSTETSCEEGEIIGNQICTNGELIPLPGTPEGPGNITEPGTPPAGQDRIYVGDLFEIQHPGSSDTTTLQFIENDVIDNVIRLRNTQTNEELTASYQLSAFQGISEQAQATGTIVLQGQQIRFTLRFNPSAAENTSYIIIGEQVGQERYTCGDLLGDVNGDGVITDADAEAILRISTEQASVEGFCADVNNDGRVNSYDAALVKRYVQGEEIDRVGTVDTSGFVEGIPLNNYESDVNVEFYLDYRNEFSRNLNHVLSEIVAEEQVSWEAYMYPDIVRARSGYRQAKMMLCLQEYVPDRLRAVHDTLMEIDVTLLDEYDENHVTLIAQTHSPLAFQRCVQGEEGAELLKEHQLFTENQSINAIPTTIIDNGYSKVVIQGEQTAQTIREAIQEAKQSVGTYECGGIVGDVTGDGIISEEDADAILDISVGRARITDNCCADVNNDGRVSSYDATLIKQYLRGEETAHVGASCNQESTSNYHDIEVQEGQLLGQATSQLTKDQLPELLGDGRVVTRGGDTYYTQTLSFNENEGGEIMRGRNDERVAGDFLVYNEGEQIFTYTLDFTQGLKSDRDGRELEDYQDEEIPFLGEYYSIVKAQHYTDQGLFLTLMRGAISDTLENLFEQQTRTYTLNGNDYTFSPEEFTEEDQVRFSINGEATPLLQAGEVYNFEGASIGVRQVITHNHCLEVQGENRGLFNVSPITRSEFLQIELGMAQTENLVFNEQDYEVQAVITSTRSALIVNGQRTNFLEEGESDEVQGLQVTYVEQTQEAVCQEEETRGIVEFYLGAEKIEFRGLQSDENARIYLNGKELVEASAQAQYTARRYYPFDLQSIEYSVEADPATRNTAYVNEGQSLHEHIENPEALLGLDIIHQGRNMDGTHTVRIQ